MDVSIFEDEITLFWAYDPAVLNGCCYTLYLNDQEVAKTDKTHYTFAGLTERTAYQVRVLFGKTVLFDDTLTTPAARVRIDASKEPYSAVGDGKTLNTAALQRAIDDCRKGQTVYLPKGVYMTGALRLHSDMELYLDDGAVLQGTDRVEDYLPKIHSRFEGIEMECYSSLINIGVLDHTAGISCENVVIRGGGSLFGGGRPLAEHVVEVERELLKDYIASLGDKVKECENDRTIPGRPRPRLINMSNAGHVTICGIKLGYGASWNVQFIYSSHIVTYGCQFYSENVWNGDGWDPDSSTDCYLFDCDFFTGDDSVAIKSGKNPQGNVIARPTERIFVFDCRSIGGHGITIGSEMSGGVSAIRIWDCDLSASFFGMEIKGTKKRGGYVCDISVDRCRMPRIMMHAVGYNDDGIGAAEPPKFYDCRFSDITLSGIGKRISGETFACDPIALSGFDGGDHAIKNVAFRRINILPRESGEPHRLALSLIEGVSFQDLSCLPIEKE